MNPNFYLAGSARIRFVTGMMMYFAQGIPDGLLAIAMPAWLAAQGADAGDIGSYLAVIYLPWAFKLIVGPLMDRYQFPAMGSRRAWVLAAQLGLTFSQLRSIRYHTRDLGIGYCGGGGGMLFRANME